MGFKGFSLKLFNADSKASPTARPDMKKKSASENEPREALPVVANSPSDEFASNSKFERPNDRPEASRKSPRTREDRAFEDDEVMRGPKPFPDKSPMDKPVLKLFLKSSDNMGKIDAFSSPSSSIMEKKEAPTLLRLRIGSGEEKLPKQETAALLIEDLVPVSEPNRPSIPVKAVSKSKKKKQQVQLEISEEPVVKQKRPYKKTVETKEEPKDIFTEPKGKKAKKEQDAKAVKVKKEKKEKKEKKTKSFPVKDKVVDAVQKEKKTRRSKKQMAAEAAAEEPLPVVAGETFVSEAVEVQHVSPTAGIVNEDFCAACKNTGYFICCETCPNSFHLACVFPPLANVPEESWQCIDCLKTRPVKKLDAEIIDAQAIVSSSNEIENYRAMWDRVWAMSILSEPSAFTLPKRLRPKKDLPLSLELLDESAYQVQPKRRSSVADMRKISSSASLTRRSTSNRNTTTAPAPSLSRRISENGQCHHCGLRSVIPELLPLRAEPIIPKPLIRCDGCPLLWHMDCLDPPLTVLPSAEKRWLCPAHVKLPVYPSFIPEVDLEDNDPFAYEMATRLCALPPPPAERIRLSESSILLDFGAKARRLREESKLNPLLPPPEVVSSYAILTESIHNVASL